MTALRRQGGPFVVVPRWVLDLSVSDRALRLYATLCVYADNEGQCWPSRHTLADRMRCSRNSVDRAVTELVDAGVLVKITRRDPNDRAHMTSLYVVRTIPKTPSPTSGPPSPTTDEALAPPVVHRTRPTELEDPPTPAADASGGLNPHHGQHKRCRACGTTTRQQVAEHAAAALVKPPWCGHCDELTRTIEFEPAGKNAHATVQRCHACHPIEIGA